MKTIKRILLLVILLAVAYVAVQKLPLYWREISFYWEDRTETELKVKKYAEEMGISYWEYPESLIDLLERNPETEDFVLQYPFRDTQELEAFSYDLSDGVPLMMQWDKRWGYLNYGSDVVGITGCGPLCLSMAGYYVTGGDAAFHPARMVEFAEKNGYYSRGNGSSWTLISEGGVKLGLDVTEIPLVKKRIMDNLEVDNPIICSMRAGDFTTSGHYIVMVGCEDGLIRINDPNSRENSEKLWSYEQIEGQIRNLWVIRDIG
ncbi:MAG: papain-like cysteine protease family protein [Firmicutes bacterium]|nr:papain-like cysteine protease family protein [Bacillota bacterium]